MSDNVKHPKHYTSHPSGIECIEIVQYMGFCIGCAIKYLWRADLKGNAIEDLKKAKQYIDFASEVRKSFSGIPLSFFIINSGFLSYSADIQKYVSRFSITESDLEDYTIIDDTRKFSIINKLFIRYIPFLIITDPDGIIRYYDLYEGTEKNESLIQTVSSLLTEENKN